MAKKARKPGHFNVVLVAQAGRLSYEAVLFCASLRAHDADFSGRLIIAEPQPGPKWSEDPRIRSKDARTLLTDEFGAEFLPFENRLFGQSYPHGNKIEALTALPPGEPFVFFDTDTLIMGPLSQVPFDFDRPSASTRVEGTWPEPQLYGAGYAQIWKSLYDRFGLDIETAIDRSQPDEYWRRYPYYNAGWFYFRCPQEFGQRFADYARQVRDDPGEALAAQSLYPWLDQIALPLVIHSFGGGPNMLPPGLLDGSVSCHYRTMPLLFARESDLAIEALKTSAAPNKVKKYLKSYEPMKRFIYQNRGAKVRQMFDRADLPPREKMIRNQIKSAGLWMR